MLPKKLQSKTQVTSESICEIEAIQEEIKAEDLLTPNLSPHLTPQHALTMESARSKYTMPHLQFNGPVFFQNRFNGRVERMREEIRQQREKNRPVEQDMTGQGATLSRFFVEHNDEKYLKKKVRKIMTLLCSNLISSVEITGVGSENIKGVDKICQMLARWL